MSSWATVRVPQLVPASPNEARREHWAQRSRRVKRERAAVRIVLAPNRPPSLPVIVTMVRCSVGTLDGDNAVGSMKAVRDEVAAWLGVDDADPRVTWRVEQERVARARAGTVLHFQERGQG